MGHGGGARRGGQRLAMVAEDLVQHFEDRIAAMDGKAMVVVHEPAHLCGALHSHRGAPARLAQRRRCRRYGQDRDDRLGRRPAEMAAAHRD